MNGVIEKVVPILMVFLFGYLLKLRGIPAKSDGVTLLKVFFNVSVPALLFLSRIALVAGHRRNDNTDDISTG